MSQSLIQPVAELALTGDLTRPARLTVPDLLGPPQHRVRVTFECATSGPQHHRFTGPRLYDVLTDTGPQLVLPQDRCGARCISGISAIRVDGDYVGR